MLLPTSAIWRLAPEKVLGTRADWASRHADELDALVRAVYRAAAWCDEPAHRIELARLLADPRYVRAPVDVVERALSGRLRWQQSSASCDVPDFLVFARHFASFPWRSHALWFVAQMVRWGQLAPAPDTLAAAREVYRPDIYRRALAPLGVAVPLADDKPEVSGLRPRAIESTRGPREFGPDGFFDEVSFDPRAVRA
jgi:NitT/TauT family transport system ATP-binding protein